MIKTTRKYCFGIAALLFLWSISFSGQNFSSSFSDDDWIALFNGKDLTGWGYKTNSFDGNVDASDGRYSAKDGMIVVHPHDPTKGPRLRQMWTARSFKMPSST